MSGNEFKRLMKFCGYTQTSLSARWGVVRQTIGIACVSDEVPAMYADAIKTLVIEHCYDQNTKLVEMIENNTAEIKRAMSLPDSRS